MSEAWVCSLFFRKTFVSSSLGEEELSLGLSALVDREERSRLVLVVDKSIHVDLSDFSHLIESKNILDILVKISLADSVKVLANLDFFRGNSAELLIV